MSKAQITHVAIRMEGVTYSLPAPARHCDVIRHIVETTKHRAVLVDMDYDQGFLDADGVFLHRKAAYARAQLNGQLQGQGHSQGRLFSEDLW